MTSFGVGSFRNVCTARSLVALKLGDLWLQVIHRGPNSTNSRRVGFLGLCGQLIRAVQALPKFVKQHQPCIREDVGVWRILIHRTVLLLI
eukprot:CAMPEP_0114167784 /NCGR_PEP_ID=MMETSP0043_2-20121206/32618_1 /TAXON_ID=464988 /ORGANISM="Hemiselmis andersenii, Strain CCMP644" /LENGTH=89 /DNA_ID=CAMNT_0001264999 /DNA_START=21 /DNA_END=290 /DNA_ORIENTATION=+